MPDDFWMQTLRCPKTGQPLRPADAATIQRANATSKNVPATAGLVTEDGQWFYPVQDGIPVLLAAEGVMLSTP